MSSASPPPEPVWFLDKCLGRKVVAEALRAAGEAVEIMEDHFDSDTEDKIWVPKVGALGWKILTKDWSLRHNLLELVALLKSNTHSFILTSMNQTGRDMAQAYVTALPQMKRVIVRHPAPLVATISRGGIVGVYLTHAQLIARIDEIGGPGRK